MLLTATFVRISNKVFMGAPLFIIGTRNLYLPQFTFDHWFNDTLELTSSDIISEQFGILCCPCYAKSHSPMPNTSHSNGSSQLFLPLQKGRELSKVKLINACFSFSPFLHIENCVGRHSIFSFIFIYFSSNIFSQEVLTRVSTGKYNSNSFLFIVF